MKSFRLTDIEEDTLYKCSMEINKQLIKLNKMPLTEAKILHEIIRQTLIDGEIEVSADGELRIVSNR